MTFDSTCLRFFPRQKQLYTFLRGCEHSWCATTIGVHLVKLILFLLSGNFTDQVVLRRTVRVIVGSRCCVSFNVSKVDTGLCLKLTVDRYFQSPWVDHVLTVGCQFKANSDTKSSTRQEQDGKDFYPAPQTRSAHGEARRYKTISDFEMGKKTKRTYLSPMCCSRTQQGVCLFCLFVFISFSGSFGKT